MLKHLKLQLKLFLISIKEIFKENNYKEMSAKPLQKERENRSADKRDLTFHAYNITPETANTAVLLLESPEAEILCQVMLFTRNL